MYNITEFSHFMPTKIIFGDDCVEKNACLFKQYKKIFIVTDKNSAKLSGALENVLSAVKDNAEYMIFDEVNENPLLSVCFGAGKKAYDFKADLIVGIGGGSPLDAAKATAFFAANPNAKMMDIYTPPYANISIPVFAIPTTAGTGSEANSTAVITLDGKDMKKSFNYVHSYPQVSFLDWKYTKSLPERITLSTAVDAFCHCVESYLSPKASPISKTISADGFKTIFDSLKSAKKAEGYVFDADIRRSLLLGSLYGGLAINCAGTGFPHPMGYNLTFEYNLPHGFACAVFLGEYLRLNSISNRAMVKEITDRLGASIDEIDAWLYDLHGFRDKLSEEKINIFVEKAKSAANFKNSQYIIDTGEEIAEIYKRIIC